MSQLDGEVTGVYADYHYVGTGDTGGATQESTARMLEAMVTKSETCPAHPGPRWTRQRECRFRRSAGRR